MTQELIIPDQLEGKVRDNQDLMLIMQGYSDVF